MRLSFVLPLLLLLLSPAASFGESYTWKPLRIGAGGWVTGIDISADGSTRVVRTDTYGAYVWDSTEWKQLVTASSMPPEDVGVDRGTGVYEIAVAPGNANRLYMSYRGFVHRSDDRGAHWTRTTFAQAAMNPNDGYRYYGRKMAVDPANPDVVYVGSQAGFFVTYNGGTTWSKVTAVADSSAGVTGIAFDASSGTTGGRTNTVWASSYGHGIYRTTDAGSTWSQVSGAPLTVRNAAVATDGIYYVCSDEAQGSWPNGLWKYSGGAWVNIHPNDPNYMHSIAPDPFNPARIVLGNDGGMLSYSLDRGATWIIPTSRTRTATDVPWLAWTQEGYMSSGDQRFDPVTPNLLWFAEGIGVWRTNTTDNPLATTWVSQSAGIEQLAPTVITSPPGGKPVVGAWDRPVFYVDNPDVYPSRHGPDNQNAIVMGWAIDYASSDPTFLVALINWWGVDKNAYSTDGGRNWTIFPSFPAWDPSNWPIGGSIAASTPDNIVWVPSNRKRPYYSTNRGASWTAVSLPGIGDTDGWDGIHWAYYLNRHIVAADRVTPGTFYLYYQSEGKYPAGVFKSTDGAATWRRVYTGEVAPWSGFNAKLKSVPDRAGHLFFTAGPQGSPGDPNPGASGFMRSTDGGVTWTAIPNVLEVLDFGFGKEAQAGGYPSIFVAGWVNNVYGVWRSDSAGQSWTQIGDFPTGSLASINAVEGDKNVYGTVYLALAGNGYAYGRVN